MEALLAAGATWNASLTLSTTDDPTRTNAQAGYFYLGTTSHWADSYFMQPFYSAFGFTPFGVNLDDASAVGYVNTVNALTFFKTQLKPIVAGTGQTDSTNNYFRGSTLI
jgi:arabinogalactan oligomer/maltooligosaccharide transport system substrate-binding protein